MPVSSPCRFPVCSIDVGLDFGYTVARQWHMSWSTLSMSFAASKTKASLPNHTRVPGPEPAVLSRVACHILSYLYVSMSRNATRIINELHSCFTIP